MFFPPPPELCRVRAGNGPAQRGPGQAGEAAPAFGGPEPVLDAVPVPGQSGVFPRFHHRRRGQSNIHRAAEGRADPRTGRHERLLVRGPERVQLGQQPARKRIRGEYK